MDWAGSVRPNGYSSIGADGKLHHHLETTSALSSLEQGISKWLLVAGAATVAVVLAPVVLPWLGIGGGVAAALTEECCAIVGTNTGVAGSLAHFIENIPAVGTYLSTAGGQNIFLPAAAILGGQAAGALVSNYEHAAGKKGRIGFAIRTASLGLGVVLALPAVLPGIGHGVQFLSRLAGAGDFGAAVAKFLGNTASCTSVATTNGIMGGVSTLAAHLPCAIPAVAASFPLLAPSLAKSGERPMLPEDLNHTLSQNQQSWVDSYNAAPPRQKIILQEWFRELGFDPDFHADGTMHLHKHPPGWSRG